jgi:dipeptidyl aminopeptidase/acylaminoacyl peptidase
MKNLVVAIRWALAAAIVAASGLNVSVHAAVPQAEDFAAPAQIGDVVVSPSGRRMAVLNQAPNGRVGLGVIDLDPLATPRVVAQFSDANVTLVRWVNDERLVFEAFQDGALVRAWGGGTFAVNHDGSDQTQLIAWALGTSSVSTAVASRILPYGWDLHSTVDDGSDDVFVVRLVRGRRDEISDLALARLNTKTRLLRYIEGPKLPGVTQWLFDAKREPRMVVARNADRESVHWKDPKSDGSWIQIAEFARYGAGSFTPRLVDNDGSVIVSAQVGSDTSALHRLDARTGKIDPQALVHVKDFDVIGSLEYDTKTGALLGVHTTTDRPVTVWFDAGLAALQRAIDTALPAGRFNRIHCGRCESSRFFVIESKSDRQPGQYLLFDRRKGALEPIAFKRPRIDETSQGTRTFHRVTTSDGLSMPVVVTHPPGAKRGDALPAVVLVHGGPWVRGTSLSWNETAQFFATRGWRVIEPEFRGSTGYGNRHFRAGWKQWGDAMQRDVVEALQWAGKSGLADANRACIVGASYGGYSALMAPILYPNAFKCAAAFAAVTDIGLMYSVHWSDVNEYSLSYGMPTLIGDPVKDQAMLEAASPLKRAAELKVPVLLTHGGVDVRVPIVHASRFLSAARAAGVKIEYHDYPDEGHGFNLPANEADHYKRLGAFIEQHLGSAAVAPSKP